MEAFPREVLVTPHERHLDVEARVVAIRLDDERTPAGSKDTPVLAERPLGTSHVVERVLRVDEVERRVRERKLLTIGDPKGESWSFLPLRRLRDVDADDVADAVSQQPRYTAVAAADVEQGLVTAKRVPELLDAPQPITKLTRTRV